MGYEELIRDLIREGEAEAGAVLERAREEAARMEAEALKGAEEGARKALESLERDLVRERDIHLDRARAQARAVLLQARAGLAEEAIRRTEDRVRSLGRRKEYPSILRALFEEIRPELPGGPIRVRSDAGGLSVLKAAVKEKQARFEPLGDEEIGGVEIGDPEDSIRIRNTWKSRLSKARPRLLVEIKRWLDEHD